MNDCIYLCVCVCVSVLEINLFIRKFTCAIRTHCERILVKNIVLRWNVIASSAERKNKIWSQNVLFAHRSSKCDTRLLDRKLKTHTQTRYFIWTEYCFVCVCVCLCTDEYSRSQNGTINKYVCQQCAIVQWAPDDYSTSMYTHSITVRTLLLIALISRHEVICGVEIAAQYIHNIYSHEAAAVVLKSNA